MSIEIDDVTDNEEVSLAKLQETIAALRNEDSALHSRENEIRARLSELTSEITRLTREKSEIERQASTRRRAINDLEAKVVSAARVEAIKREQADLIAEFEEASKELHELTKDAVWRTGIKQESGDIHKAFPYQIEGGAKLAVAKRGILGDKRGLGKTLTSIVWADMVQAKKIILIAPNDVVSQFEGELREWAPHRTIFSMSGLNPPSRKMVFGLLSMPSVDEFIITLNYEAWRRDKTIIDGLVALGVDTIMLDEAHRAKSSDKITARGIFQIAYRPNRCDTCDYSSNAVGPWVHNGKIDDKFTFYSEKDRIEHRCIKCDKPLTTTVKNVLSMTGTPILNKPQELFSLLFLINPLLFPTENKFLSDWCYVGANGRWQFRPGGLARLTKMMSAFFIQRNRDDIGIDIPPPAITVHRLDKDLVKYAKQYKAEKEINAKAQMMLEDGTRKDIFYILELILRQRQCMVWPAGIELWDTDMETGEKTFIANFDVEESQKMDAATDLLNELVEEGERVIVFSQFKPPLYEMKNRFEKAGVKVTMATGDQTKGHKDLVKQDFDLKFASKDNYRWQVCFATYKAFGTGINLNAARHMIILDDEWNPGNEDQAIGRIDRINSTDQANVHIFRVNNSIDDFMERLLEEKRKITAGFGEAITAADLLKAFQ
jgi:SNF2 family DNA or RNA helicase